MWLLPETTVHAQKLSHQAIPVRDAQGWRFQLLGPPTNPLRHLGDTDREPHSGQRSPNATGSLAQIRHATHPRALA